MDVFTLTALIAGAGATAFSATVAASDKPAGGNSWVFPAILSAAFLAWSTWAVISEGPFGFWVEHTRNIWGNQIWFDLLFAASVAWWLIVPRARRAGMQIWLWLVIVLSTGCIGLLAMVARLLYREQSIGASA